MDFKVSVIIPVYNVEKYLYQCLESVVNQTLENDLEIICINDGSTDGSLGIIKEFSRKDKRIVLINKPNGGYGAACNMGLDLARGEYLTILEPDDFVDVAMYEQLYVCAKYENAPVVKSPFYEYVDADDEHDEIIRKVAWENEFDLPDGVFSIQDYPQFFYFHPSIWSCLYKTEFLRKNNIRFVEAKGAGWVDNPFQVQTLWLAKKIAWTNEAYYYYRYINPEASSVLKDFSIPFKRCDEIHSFLEETKIHDENILAYLYKREFGYIDDVLRGIEIRRLEEVKDYITEMITRMDTNIIETHNAFSDHELCLYKSFALNFEKIFAQDMGAKTTA